MIVNSNPIPTSMIFDGQDDYVELPEMELDFSKGLTLEAWVYYHSYKSYIICLGDVSKTKHNNNILLCNLRASPVLTFHVFNNGECVTQFSSKEGMEREKWLHIAVCIDEAGYGTFYKNGILVNSEKVQLPNNVKRAGNYIGKTNVGRRDQFFHGCLGEIRLWNTARSQAEIVQDMHRWLTGNEPGLLGYWPLNNEGSNTIAYDKTSNNHHGTTHGGATWEPNQLPITSPEFLAQKTTLNPDTISSMAFDGQDDYVELPEIEFDFSTGLTLEAWVYYLNYKRSSRIIEFGNGTSDNNILLYIPSNTRVPAFLVFEGSRRVTLFSSQEEMEPQQWLHMAVSIDASGHGAFYKNGILVNSEKVQLPNNVKRTQNYIGKSSWVRDKLFHGYLSEIRLWNIARSSDEIAEAMYHPLTGNEPGLVGYWPLDEGSGAIAFDKTPHNHHGIIRGAPTWLEEELPITTKPETPSTNPELSAKKVLLSTKLVTPKTEYQTISNSPPEYPGMDFALLRQEGIKHIERLAGQIWTDYNTHDPGITILEAVCYAITDLSYRLSFPIADLLASPLQEEREDRKQFFTARQILTVNPLTINDYRKLLIDIDGVKNAWLEPIQDPEPRIYYDPEHYNLAFESPTLPEFVKLYSEEVKLNGLYRVQIEKEPGYNNSLLKQEVEFRLHQHRNLCEDFAEVEISPIEEITVKAVIEVHEGFDINYLMAKIYFELDAFISPSIQFFTLKELLEKGLSPEEIFNGPPLEHGFIDDEQLLSFGRKDELHTSDLIHIILDIEGIKTIRSITISSNQSPEPEEWALDLGINTTPQLKDLSLLINENEITLYKGQIACQPNLEKVQNKLKLLHQERKEPPSITEKKDLTVPTGQYRELSEYESIQNDFPSNYGIGELGLPPSASPKRQAQAKQLQAYLMFFDQLLANYFAQLDRVKDLFSFHTQDNKTYFSQELIEFPGAAEVLTEYPPNSTEDGEIDLERRNRFLDYLMAQYCEKFTDHSLLLYESILEEKVIENKVAFLQDYPRISANRGQAFNYTDANQTWNTDNVSGLKRRISSLLGIPYTRQNLAGSKDVEGFHLIEHILLRPRSGDSPDPAQGLTFSRPIAQFAQSTQHHEHVTCSAPQHGLKEGEQIKILDAGSYDGIHLVTNIQPDTFDIKTAFTQQEGGKWVRAHQHRDPFSFQISFVFPNWLTRFQQPTFKQLIQEILITETPAHITVYCHWFNKEEMQTFEDAYRQWLTLLTDKNSSAADIKVVANQLIELLKIGSPEFVVRQTPKVIGYMVIEGTPDNIFTVV